MSPGGNKRVFYNRDRNIGYSKVPILWVVPMSFSKSYEFTQTLESSGNPHNHQTHFQVYGQPNGCKNNFINLHISYYYMVDSFFRYLFSSLLNICGISIDLFIFFLIDLHDFFILL